MLLPSLFEAYDEGHPLFEAWQGPLKILLLFQTKGINDISCIRLIKTCLNSLSLILMEQIQDGLLMILQICNGKAIELLVYETLRVEKILVKPFNIVLGKDTFVSSFLPQGLHNFFVDAMKLSLGFLYFYLGFMQLSRKHCRFYALKIRFFFDFL